jgi:hypothetical protein
MSAKQKAKVKVTLEVDSELVEHMENAIRHLPPGWDRTRLFEVGAVELLEQLERKYNQGRPFPQSPSA